MNIISTVITNLLLFFALVLIFEEAGIGIFIIFILLKGLWPKILAIIDPKQTASMAGIQTLKAKVKNASPPSFKLPQMQIPKLKISISLIVTIAIILIIFDGFTSIPAGHVGVIYDRGRGVLSEVFPEGLHIKIPLWQVVEKIDTRLQAYTMSIDPGEGQIYGDDSIESLTKDGQKVHADITIQYRVPGTDAPWIYQNVGLDFESKVIRPGIRNVARDIITGYDSTKLFTQETRIEAQEKMKEQLKGLYLQNKIELQEVLLRNIRFSEIYLQAIEDKQVAQQRIQKAEYERQEAEKAKETKIIEAQAEAEAIRLKGETLRANPQVIQFEFVQKMSDDINWGVLPNDILPLVDLKQFNQ